MHKVEPTIFLVAHTNVNHTELGAYLEHIGASEWESDATTDVEEIVEVMGRSCYKSFGPGLNRNVTKVREHNKDHVENIIKIGHGSVLEHAWTSWMLCDVSRVLTHELVRHRAGTAISQESLRYVRMDDMGLWVPPCFQDSPEAISFFESHWKRSEYDYERLLILAAKKEGYASFEDMPFELKKKYTSAARRVAPEGLSTNIGWSCNMRALRHVIEQRTHPSSEEEIRYVFGMVAKTAIELWPYLFGDYTVEVVDNLPHYSTKFSKV